MITNHFGSQGLRDHGKMKSGDRVLVIGGSGGCGAAGIQLALAMGTHGLSVIVFALS